MTELVHSMTEFVIGISILLIAISNSKTNKIINRRIDNIHDRLLNLEYPENIPKEERPPTLNELAYRLDIIEGKHLRARNLGIGGLPQPRKKTEENP